MSTRYNADRVLTRMLTLLQKGWCQRSIARDRHGHPVMATSKNAVRWCLMGTFFAQRTQLRWYAFRLLFKGEMARSPLEWNDDPKRTQADVLSLVRRVRDRLRKEGR